MARLELYGSSGCPYTEEMRQWLQWNRREFVEYDLETDSDAQLRLRSIDSSLRTVPVLVEDGKVIQVGWQGRGCVVDSRP
jgi:glutaredoxin